MSKLLHAIRAAELEKLQASALTEALLETGERVPTAARSAAGDAARLRGLPMIGAGGGHIPGTRPGTGAHLHQLDRRRRRDLDD